MEKRDDRRVTMTKRLLKDALIELLRQKLFAPLNGSRKLKGFFDGLDERLRRLWRG